MRRRIERNTSRRDDMNENNLNKNIDSKSKSDSNSNSKRAVTSTGHYAGLQTGESFGAKERALKTQRDLDMQGVDRALSGEQAETIYRDRISGRKKTDMVGDFMREAAVKEGKKLKLQQAQQAWRGGAVQKEEVLAARRELEEVALEPFARGIDDVKLEDMKKEVIRDGDPMAEYFLQQQQQEDGVRGVEVVKRPVYRGPAAPANRFGVRPGYRWDGVDRGSSYERKILTRDSMKASDKEDAYKWAVSDM